MRKIVCEAEILEYMSSHLEVSISALREQFPVSTATLNRMLASLKRNNWVKVEKDKVVYSPITYFSYHMKDIGAKINLARYAVGMLEEGNIVGLAGGSTTVSLMMPFLLLQCRNITVISSSLLVLKYYLDLEYLARENHITLITVGGQIRPEEHAIGGEYTNMIIQNYHMDHNFISGEGADEDRGLFTSNPSKYEMERYFMEISEKNHVICTKAKFQKKHLYKWADWEEFDTLITDGSPSLSVSGCRIVTVQDRK